MLDFHEIKSNLMGLSRAELSDLRKTIDVLLERNVEIDPNASMLYDVMQTCLCRKGLASVNIIIYKKQKPDMFNKMCDSALTLSEWMKQVGVLKKLEQKLLMTIICEIIVESIERTNVPVNMTTLIGYFRQGPSLFNNSFPGYAENGMIPFLIKSRKARNETNI